jgi:hypothetical protein
VKKVLVVLLGLIVGLVVVGAIVLWFVDQQARKYAQTEAEKRITERVVGSEGVDVEVDGFIVLFDVAVRGKIEGLHVRVDAIRSHGIELREIQLDIEDIELDRDQMLDDRRIVVTGISGASLVGYLHDDVVTKAAKHEVTFSRDGVTAEFRGHKVTANVAVRQRRVELSAAIPGAAPMTFPLPDRDILPCDPTVEVQEGRIELACHIDELPEAVRQAMGS